MSATEQAIMGMGIVSIVAMLINGALCHIAINRDRGRMKDQ